MKNQQKNNCLRITSFLEIIMGIISIILIRFLLVQDGSIVILSKELEVTALWGIILIYGVNIFKIIAGMLGLCFVNKKSILTVLCGIILIGAHSSNVFVGEFSVLAIIIDVIPMLIPAYYLYGAIRNYKTQE